MHFKLEKTSIVFPQKANYPIYTVDFNTDKDDKEATTPKKVQACVQRSFQLVGVFFISFKDSFCRTLGGAGTSFKYTVLGYYGSWSQVRLPKNVHLVVFKIVFWVASMGWGIVATTSRLFLERTSPGHSLFLKQFASDEMDVDHIKIEELGLDASCVPKEVTVNTLKDLFLKINFVDKKAPGYMAETTCREITLFSPEELAEKLETFIRRVNTREAFLGTPPGHDVPRLMDFYQQIEDAVRLSIYKAAKDVTDFETQNGTNFANFSIEQKRKYNDLLEIRARVALDLAIAGDHYGARYMGEAMDVYYSIYNKEGMQNDKDLQGTLVEILAKKREEIAKGQIQTHLGADTHEFTKYMGNMGKLLGIPGTKNIIEHLSTSIDTHQLLHYFFQEYTVDTIIDTVQEKIKTSQSFREKITDWIQDQVKDWNHDKYENIGGIVKEIEDIRNSSIIETPSALNFQIVQDLLLALKNEKVAIPATNEGWDNFLTKLFALDEVTGQLKNRFPLNNEESEMQYTIRFRAEVHSIKEACTETVLGIELLQALQRALASDIFTPIHPSRYMPKFVERAKIEKMKRVLSLEQGTSLRVLKGEVNLTTAIRNYQEQARRNEFLKSFDLKEMAETGLSKELLEWLLVSQKILRPQTKIESNQNQVSAYLAENQVQSYVRAVHEEFCKEPSTPEPAKNLISLPMLHEMLNANRYENIEDQIREIFPYVSTPGLSEKRYRQKTDFEREKALTWIFNQSFQHDSDKVIAAAESSTGEAFYPQWKKVCWIQIPKIPADLFSNTYFKIALTVSAIAISTFSVYQAYAKVSQFFTARGIPFIMNYVPLQVIRSGNAIVEAKEFIWENPVKVIAATWLVRTGIGMLPELPYLSAAARVIDPWRFYRYLSSFPETILSFAFRASSSVIGCVWNNASQEISQQFRRISDNAEKERLAICKQKSLRAWKDCKQAALV